MVDIGFYHRLGSVGIVCASVLGRALSNRLSWCHYTGISCSSSSSSSSSTTQQLEQQQQLFAQQGFNLSSGFVH
jgi:hypothetical protein